MKVHRPFSTLAAAGVAERLTTFTATQVDKGSKALQLICKNDAVHPTTL